MSDCRHGGRDAYEGYRTLRLTVEFADGSTPWMYNLALNGREVSAVKVGGKTVIPHICEKCGATQPEPLEDPE